MIAFELPDDVIVPILSSWIDMLALTKLDSALCASQLRRRFFGIIANEWFVADTMCACSTISGENYIRHFGWLIKRQVKVRNWIVDGDVSKLCSPPIIERLAGPHVRSLHLRFLSAERTVTVFSTLAMACSGIQALRIENCEYWETLSVLGEATLQTLQELVVESCETHDCDSYPQFTNLQKLHVRYLGGVDVKQSVTSLLKAAPNLADLRLSSRVCCPISDEGLHMLSNHAAGLETLELTMERQEFTPAAVVCLAERCSNLKTLVLLYGDGISDVAVEAFALHCRRLEGLQLWGEFTAALLSAVAMHCGPRLRFLMLDMGQCDGDGLVAVADHCLRLEELQLYNCNLLADDSAIQRVSSLPQLREFVLL
jgi:hypothetical protein